ncbi:MAG: hypothetical protein FWF85_02475 [Clostridiales bacterium]|nr:hypothetical protein [Clostridiales bacterium]
MIYDRKRPDMVNDKLMCHFYMTNLSDMPDLPGPIKIAFGSDVVCLEDGNTYVLDAEVQDWIKKKNNTTPITPPLTGYENVEIPEMLRAGTLNPFMSSKGEMFFGNSGSNTGIWWLDKDTKDVVQVIATGTNWLFFEGPDGEVFASCNSGNAAGIWIWSKNTFEQIPGTAGIAWYRPSITAAGLFVVSNTSSSLGIKRWNALAQSWDEVWGAGYNYRILEVGNKIFACSATASVTGLLEWDSTVNAFVQLLSTGYNYANIIADNAGNDFIASDTNGTDQVGIWMRNETAITRVFPTGYSWRFFKTSTGKLFAWTTNNSNLGILQWDPVMEIFDSVWSTGYNFALFESSAGRLVAYGPSSSFYGILEYDQGVSVFNLTYAYSYNWKVAEDLAGNIYASAISITSGGSPGILRVNPGGGISQLYPLSYGWSLEFEENGILFFSSYLDPGIIRIDTAGGAGKASYAAGRSWAHWSTAGGKITVSNNALGGILEYNPDTQTFEVSVADFTGKPFADGFTFFSDLNTNGRLYKDGKAAVLPAAYSEQVTTENGKWGYALAADKSQILYNAA